MKSCPNCGCEDVKINGRRTFARVTWISLTCNYCSTIFRDHEEAREPVKVDFFVLRCPFCQSDRVRTSHTARPVRSHQCLECGKPFQSIEK